MREGAVVNGVVAIRSKTLSVTAMAPEVRNAMAASRWDIHIGIMLVKSDQSFFSRY